MIKRALLLLCFSALVSVALPPATRVLAMDGCRWEMSPYGGYAEGSKWGWYGARIRVGTVEEARSILNDFYSDKNVAIRAIKERRWYFEAEIRDEDDNLLDRVIVDKRTGRIRSIY